MIAGLGSRQIFYRLRLWPLTFFKQLRLPIFFPSGSGSWFFLQAAPAPSLRSQKDPAPDYWLSFFSPQTSKTAKNIIQVK